MWRTLSLRALFVAPKDDALYERCFRFQYFDGGGGGALIQKKGPSLQASSTAKRALTFQDNFQVSYLVLRCPTVLRSLIM